MNFADFNEIWLADFEFFQPDGERPTPLCLVAREFRSGRLIRLWHDDLTLLPEPPFPIDSNSLFVAYYASAELGCHLALDWGMPACILDLYAEFKCKASGRQTPCGFGLLGASTYHGLDSIESAEKDSMRGLAMRGGPYTVRERADLLDYCQSDVDALAKLLPAMIPQIDLPRALLRGRYMTAAARMEWNGIPIDVPVLRKLRSKWDSIQDHLIDRIDRDYGVYDGRTFKSERWAAWLVEKGVPWAHTPSGSLALDDETFRQAARMYPEVSAMRELRATLSKLRLHELAVGYDGRNRCLLSAFASKTGRNQPSNAKFIFGPATWLRGLIKPAPDTAVAYIDYEQQEFAIGAALSGDHAMMDAYTSGDPYLAFAKQAGAVPPNATKETHKDERDQFKVCALATQYGMGATSLAIKLGEPIVRARELLHLHRETYHEYWRWSDAARDYAMLSGRLQTVFGWTVHVGTNANPRSLRNFPIQANGAEMLRLACCRATEQGIKVCAPVHDALLIEAPLAEIDQTIEHCQAIMREASEIILGGYSLRTDVEVVRYPDRYMDKRGAKMWEVVCDLT
ncbi:MAG: DNA polymerase I [Candidatus Nealsonbacteria bacterium]|nr:DNA polymerase I [Candidatus Nealsonbacteria bacterium]